MVGRVVCEGKSYVAELDVVDWVTHGDSLEDVLADVPKMILEYFSAFKKKDKLPSLYKTLGVKGSPKEITIKVTLDLSPPG